MISNSNTESKQISRWDQRILSNLAKQLSQQSEEQLGEHSFCNFMPYNTINEESNQFQRWPRP